MSRSSLLVPLIFIPLATGCTHLEYAQGPLSITALDVDDPDITTQSYEIGLKVHELQVLDTTGVVCASLGTALEAGNAYTAARDEALKAGHSTFTYKYRPQSPSEYSGVQCGAYARWGSGVDGTHMFWDYDAATYTEPERYELLELPLPEMKMGEGGFHIGGVSYFTPKVPALRWSLLWRLGMGRYRLTPYQTDDPDLVQLSNQVDVDDDGMFVRSPFHVGVLFYPKYLLGFGAHVYGGIDPVGALFTRDGGKGWQKLDYGARVGYTATVKMFALSAGAEWHHYNFSWNDFWTQEEGWLVGGSVSFDPDGF